MTRLIAFLFRVASLIPPLVAYRLSRIGARVLLAMKTDAARTTVINIDVCFPEETAAARRQLARESLAQMLFLGFEVSYIINWPTPRLLDQISAIEGRELLDSSWQDPRGILLLHPHFGHFELISVFLGEHYSMASLYDPPRIEALDPVISGARERHGGEMFPINASGLRGIMRVIKNGGLAIVLPDQVPGRRAAGIASTFFDLPVLTMSLSYRIKQSADPHVIVSSIERKIDRSGIRYIVRFERLDGDEGTEQAHADAVNRAVEKVVERAPAQYQWEYKRFRRSLGDERGNIYQRRQ